MSLYVDPVARALERIADRIDYVMWLTGRRELTTLDLSGIIRDIAFDSEAEYRNTLSKCAERLAQTQKMDPVLERLSDVHHF